MAMEKLESLEQKEATPEWENLIDEWVEDKIQKQMDRFKISDKKEAEEIVREKFKKVFPRVFKDFAVHGIASASGGIEQVTDMDGRVCLGLLGLAGFNIKEKGKDANVSFIDHAEQLEGVLHLDVGNKNISESSGIAFLKKTEEGLKRIELSDENTLKEEKNKNMFFSRLGMVIDHHPEGAPSASGMVYKILDKMGFLEDNKKIDEAGGLKKIKKMVKFIDIVDSNGFQEIGKPENWDNSDRTILGLYRFMKFTNLLNFFKEDGNYARPLIDEVLKRYGLIYYITGKNNEKVLINRQKQQREIIDGSNKKIDDLQKKGFIIESKIGKIIIDIDKKLPGGASAAQSIGASYLNWSSWSKTFFLFSQKELGEDFSEIGIVTRKYLCLLPKKQKGSGLKLRTIIDKISGAIPPGSGLESYLKSEN